MKFSASLAAELLVGAFCLIGGAYAGCSQDSCYRDMFPGADPTRLASALSFCQTYTLGVSTATTGFVPRFTAACGSNPATYSSACSCAPTVTTTTTISTTLSTSKYVITSTITATKSSQTCAPTPYEVYQNGDFECGIYPWRALVTNGTTYALTSPGSKGTTTAFQATQSGRLDGVGIGQALLIQLFYITQGVQYTLTFDTYWSAGNGGFIGVKLNGQPQYTVDASDKNGPGVWNSNTFSFTATTGQYELEFEFEFGATPVYAKIDNVVLSRGT